MPDAAPIIRLMTADDLPAVAEIYAYYVARSTCTFDTEPRPMDGWRTWLAHHRDAHPATVALRDGTIVGWGSLSAWSDRPAYRHTVEDSVYVRHDMHRQGIGGGPLGGFPAP